MIEVRLLEDGSCSRMKEENNLGAGPVRKLCCRVGDGQCRQKEQSSEGLEREGKTCDMICAKVGIKDWKTNLLWRWKRGSVLGMLNLRPPNDP